MQKKMKKGNGGFSLVELIIVIAIMATLLGVVVQQYTRYTVRSQISKDLQTVEEIAQSFQATIASNVARGKALHDSLPGGQKHEGAYVWRQVNGWVGTQIYYTVPSYTPDGVKHEFWYKIDENTLTVKVAIKPADNDDHRDDQNKSFVVYPVNVNTKWGGTATP